MTLRRRRAEALSDPSELTRPIEWRQILLFEGKRTLYARV